MLGGLIVVLFVSGFVLYRAGKKKLSRTYPNTVTKSIGIPNDSNAVARGKHISIIWACTKCHGEDLSGKRLTKDPLGGNIPLFTTLSIANLTSGKGGVGRIYNNVDWIRAIRHGVKPNNRPEAFMYFSNISDQDLGDLIVYLKQIPPVDRDSSALRYGAVIPIAYGLGIFPPVAESTDQNAVPADDPLPGATIQYGKYLYSICAECHFNDVSKTVKKWSQEDFINTFHTGVLPNGKQFGPTMSSKTFSEMNEMELSALWLYLHNESSEQAKK